MRVELPQVLGGRFQIGGAKMKDLITQTVEYLEASPLLIFATAKLYANKPVIRSEAEAEVARWRKTGKYGTDTEDFCLDILSKRIGLDSILTKKLPKKGLK